MLKLFNRKKKDNKGFTLVELVVVIAILAILVGLLAPQYTKYVEKSRKSADATNLDEMVKVVKIFAADPQHELPAGKYAVEITPTGGAKLYKNGQPETTGDLYTELTSAIKEFTSIKTKSQKWGGDSGAVSIFAVIEIDPEGGTAVTYSPKKLADYVGGTEAKDGLPSPSGNAGK